MCDLKWVNIVGPLGGVFIIPVVDNFKGDRFKTVIAA